MGIGRLLFCLMSVTLLSSSCSLLAQGTDLLDISCGATAASGSYAADKDFSGGTAVTSTNTITTTGVTNPAPEAVYQHQRYGNFTYTLPGFTSGTTYLVRLHFDEFYWTAAGKREFNVLINGTQVLTGFDIFATAGGDNIAVVELFNAVANTSGQIVIQFVSVVDNAEINGIEIESGSSVSPTEGPYGGTAAAIPGTVLAENYDTGGQNVAYNVTAVNGTDNGYRSQGIDLETAAAPATGNDLGWTATGQWFKYTVNVATAGTYTVSFVIASPTAVADAFHISNSSGTNLSGAVAVPATGGFQAWVTVKATVTLPAGTQTLTVNQDNAGWNIDSMAFALNGGAPTCTTKPNAPTGLAASGTSSTGTTLSWTGDTAPANCSISSYTVLKNGASIGTAAGTSFAVTGLTVSTNYSFTVEATDAAGTSAASAAVSVTTSASGGGEAPFGGTAAAVPGTIMAENYDTGGQGVAYNITAVNGTANAYRSDGVDLETATAPATGNDLGWTAAGQWFKYTVNVSTAGTYTVSFLVASPTAVADAFHLSNSSGTNLTGSVAVPGTGGYQDWVTVTATVTLPAGTQTLTLNEDAAGWNIDSMDFAASTGGGGGGGGVPIANAGFYFTPQNAPAGTLVMDDAGAGIGAGNPIDVYTPNSTVAQAWAVNNSGVTPAGFYNMAVIGPYCLTASGATSGSLVVLDPCLTNPAQAWEAVASGTNYIFHPDNNLALCLTASGTAVGDAVDVDTCNGSSSQGWALNPSNTGGTGKGGGSNCAGVGDLTVVGTTYTPSWCQEFSGAAGPPSTAAFNFDLGNNSGWGNGEAEVYCGPPGYPFNPAQCPTTFSTATAPVYQDGNGHLVIQPRNVGGTWISARLNTDGGQLFQYGILEASIQLPDMNPQGLWPAFWGLGNNLNSGVPWPNCGETDILEDWSPAVLGGAGDGGENSTIHTALTGGDGVSTRYLFPGGEAVNTAFHTYGMIWSPNKVEYFVDNPSAPFATLTPGSLPAGDTWPFNQPIFMVLNEAIGGTLGGNDAGINPGPMTVDYIRWYQAQ
jgi:beta-glucanase (GH16 family)